MNDRTEFQRIRQLTAELEREMVEVRKILRGEKA